jgi:hypothetical protein
VRTYITNGRYTKDAKERLKTRVIFKKHKLTIENVTDRSYISGLLAYGTRRKWVDEWSLAPDRQTLTLKTRNQDQSVQIGLCGGDPCPGGENDIRKQESERVYTRRVLLNDALEQASEGNQGFTILVGDE